MYSRPGERLLQESIEMFTMAEARRELSWVAGWSVAVDNPVAGLAERRTLNREP